MKDSVLTFLPRMFRSRRALEGWEADFRRGSDICTPHPSYIIATIMPGHRLWTSRPSFKLRQSLPDPRLASRLIRLFCRGNSPSSAYPDPVAATLPGDFSTNLVYKVWNESATDRGR